MADRSPRPRLFDWRDRIVSDPSLKAPERHVALTLSLRMRPDECVAWPSVPTLASECARTETTVRASIEKLVDGGYIVRRAGGPEGLGGRGHTSVCVAVFPEELETLPSEEVIAYGEAVRASRSQTPRSQKGNRSKPSSSTAETLQSAAPNPPWHRTRIEVNAEEEVFDPASLKCPHAHCGLPFKTKLRLTEHIENVHEGCCGQDCSRCVRRETA